MSVTVHAHGHIKGKHYIISEDLGEKIVAFRSLGLTTPESTDTFFNDLQDQLAAAVQAAVGEGVSVDRVSMRELAEEVNQVIRKTWDDPFVISTCPEIASPPDGASIQINRVIDLHGRKLGYGPRPGAAHLAAQFEAIADQAKGRPTVIAEDGIFTGGTLDYSFKWLRTKRVNVVGIASGFSFKDHINSILDHVETHAAREYEGIHDWVPDHDFIPFTPGSGKVLGFKMAGAYHPFYDHDHASFSMSYVQPFGDVIGWASIPAGNASSFSAACLRIAIELFTELERVNGKEIMVSDIIRSPQRVSIPVSLDTAGPDHVHLPFPTVQHRVIDFLSKALDSLA